MTDIIEVKTIEITSKTINESVNRIIIDEINEVIENENESDIESNLLQNEINQITETDNFDSDSFFDDYYEDDDSHTCFQFTYFFKWMINGNFIEDIKEFYASMKLE